MQTHVDTITKKLNEVVEENKRIEAALISNNEDERNTNLLFGETLELADALEKENKVLRNTYNNEPIGFALCGAGIGVGSAIMTYGVMNNDIGKTLTGVGIDAASIGLWCLFHYVFKVF